MARPRPDTVDKLIDLLILPVGGLEDDTRPQAMESEIKKVSEDLGWLVFEDAKWFEYDGRRIEDTLDPWLSDDLASEFDTVAQSAQLAEFLTWVENLIAAWKSGEAGVSAQTGAEGEGTGALRGLKNPSFEPDRVPGTEFYKYQDSQYLYAAMADAPADRWKTLEDRYDDKAAAAGPVPSADAAIRGYPYASSVLPGTRYYRLDGEKYLYGPTEFGAADEWQPYEYWQEQAGVEESASALMGSLDTLIALLESQLEQSK